MPKHSIECFKILQVNIRRNTRFMETFILNIKGKREKQVFLKVTYRTYSLSIYFFNLIQMTEIYYELYDFRVND